MRTDLLRTYTAHIKVLFNIINVPFHISVTTREKTFFFAIYGMFFIRTNYQSMDINMG